MAPVKSKGRKPVQQTRVQVTISLPPELVEKIDEIAAKVERSRSKMMEIVMREHVEATQV